MALAIVMNSSIIAFHLCFILGEPVDSSEHKGVNVKQRLIFSLVQNTNVLSTDIIRGDTMYVFFLVVFHTGLSSFLH